MNDEPGLLRAIDDDPHDDAARLVYADWLEERGDLRSHYLRLEYVLTYWPPDHHLRPYAEQELAWVAGQINPHWRRLITRPALPHHPDNASDYRSCDCLSKNPQLPMWLHRETQDRGDPSWVLLEEQIATAGREGYTTFNPFGEVDPQTNTFVPSGVERAMLTTLPPSIGTLTQVRELTLYGSWLSRIPPEIGDMTALETFTPYTSYRLHWFPYEITRCTALRDSTVSTRALYGNYKHRSPFPRLEPRIVDRDGREVPDEVELRQFPGPSQRPCSVCRRDFIDRRKFRVWISLNVATDVLPLLVNACSQECVRSLPKPPEDYVQKPHRGGPDIEQPPPRW